MCEMLFKKKKKNVWIGVSNGTLVSSARFKSPLAYQERGKKCKKEKEKENGNN